MSSKTDVKVLVADDDATLLDLMVHRFNKMGLKVDRVDDGRQAQKSIERTNYDLIVTDIYMPGATGLALLKKAKEKDPHVQVVVVTAGATLDNAIEALNNGAFAYLLKPFDHISVFDKIVSRALEFRQLLLDNMRMAQTQRRRGDMLEDEVTQRVHQLRQRQRDLLDLLGSLPDGVIVVEEGGRVLLSSPVAEKWLARELRSEGQPIQRFLETIHDEWAEDTVEVNVGSHVLRLTATDLPSVDEKKRKVVIIREKEDMPTEVGSQLSDPLAHLKQGLAWLYNKKIGLEVSEVLKNLALQVSELERLTGLRAGANGGSQPVESEHNEHIDDQVSELSVSEVESPVVVHEPQVEEQIMDEPEPDIAPPPEPLPQSGLLRKHLLRPQAEVEEDEPISSVDEGIDKQPEAIDSAQALETLQDILDQEVAVESDAQDIFNDSEKLFERVLDEALQDPEVEEGALDDTILESVKPPASQERTSSKRPNWPPLKPSASDDFDEY